MPNTGTAARLSAISCGCSMMQGTHQEAQKFTTTGPGRPTRSAEARPGRPLLASGGSAKGGGGRPISAEGTPRGLKLPSLSPRSMNQKPTPAAAAMPSGA